jgi:hypothetical protein
MFIPIAGLWAKCGDHFPYLFCIASAGKLKLDLNKIAEAVIIAVIVGAIVGWSIRPALDILLDKITHVEQRVDKIYEDIYAPSIPEVKK